MRKLLLSFALVLATSVAFAHGVQVAYRVLPNGFVRVYVEHWHGDQTVSSLQNNGMSITTTYGATSVTQNLNPTGAVNNTSWSNLPGGGTPITILKQCPGEANTWNDWAYYDFAPAACGVPISIRLNQGNTVVLQEACGDLYPVTINATFNDNAGPVLSCPAPVANVPCGSNGTNVSFAATAVDNCGVAGITYSIQPGSFFPVGTTNVTATATDVNGFTAQCTFPVTVKVVDNTLPSVTCPPSVSLINEAGTCGARYDYSIPFSDNCGIATITQTGGLPSGAVFPVGTTTNTFTISDPSGNAVNCSFTVTVTDAEPPTVIAQNPSVLIDASGNATLTAAALDSGSYDNCGPVSLSISGRTSFTCADAGRSFPVILTVTDNAGLSTSASVMVNVIDPNSICNRAPIAKCRTRTVLANTSCVAPAAASLFNNGSSDPDGDPITFSVSPAGPYSLGTTVLVFTVTDSKGASSSCTTSVTVLDRMSPAVVAPAAVTVTAANGACTVSGIVLGSATASDNCSPVTISNDAPASYPIGTTIVTWFATDAAGNVGAGYQKVTVINSTPPSISATAPISVSNGTDTCGATVAISTPLATSGCSTNECGSDNIDSYSLGAVSGQSPKWTPWPFGTSAVVTTAQAYSGTNSVQLSNSQDQLYLLGNKTSGKWTVKWKMLIPQGKTAYFNTQHFETAGLEFGQQVQFSSTGNALLQTAGALTPFTYQQGQWFDVEQHFDLDADQTTFYVNGTAIKTWQYSMLVNNNPGTKQLGSLDFFAHTATLGGIEPNPLAQSLYYIDDISFCGSNDASVTGTRSDNQLLTDVYPVGTTTITWTAVDGNGLASTSSQTVTVTDNQAPAVACGAASYSKIVDNAGCSYLVKGSEFDITATDNCGVATIVNDYNNGSSLSGAAFPKGSTTVNWSVTDIHGNVSHCSSTVNVSTALSVSIAGSSVLPQGVNTNTIYIGYAPASVLSLSASGSGSGSNQYSYQWSVSGNLSIVGANNASTVKVSASNATGNLPYVVTVVVTDGYGCTSTATFTVSVVDVRCGNKNDKVLVCHKTGSNSNPWVQVCVAPSAVASHLANGSYLGACTSSKSTVSEPVVKASIIRAFPNPSNGVFEIRLIDFTPGKYQVEVIDQSGKLVTSRNVVTQGNLEHLKFDLNSRASGNYFVRISGGKQVMTTQVVIAR